MLFSSAFGNFRLLRTLRLVRLLFTFPPTSLLLSSGWLRDDELLDDDDDDDVDDNDLELPLTEVFEEETEEESLFSYFEYGMT